MTIDTKCCKSIPCRASCAWSLAPFAKRDTATQKGPGTHNCTGASLFSQPVTQTRLRTYKPQLGFYLHRQREPITNATQINMRSACGRGKARCSMERSIEFHRRAAERLARRWLDRAGVSRCHYGFTHNAGFYLILRGFDGKRAKNYSVPCGGVHALRRAVDEYIGAYRKP